MKELSIEEKAKRYDEAMERARQFSEKPYLEDSKGIVDYIFPELKESEDEKIRKALIKYFTLSDDNADYQCCGVHYKDIVAWLEKQVAKVSAIEGFETEFERQVSGLIASAINKEHEYNQGYVKWTANALLNYAKHELEKPCEQKPVPDWMPKFLDELRSKKNYFDWDEDKDIEGGILAIINWMNPNYFNEKDGEQKSAEISNICEFSIKTWIKIVDYVLTEHNGIGNYLIDPEVKDTAEKLQKKYKFDAASEEWDRVYRKGFDAGVNKGRAEALREQKPVEWSAYDKATLEYIIEDIKELLDSETDESSIEAYERELNLLQAINESTKLSNYTNPAQWSEEDEKMLNDILMCGEHHCYLDVENINWLKSLKDRVQLQPKQDWSEEDKSIMESILSKLYSDENVNSDKYYKYHHWFKSLKDRYTWKPSTLQIEALESATENCAYSEYQDCLRELAKQLKKL